MGSSRSRLIGFWFIIASAGLGISATGWKTFKSAKCHFSVDYPDSWYVEYDARICVLDINNFPPSKKVQGVVLPHLGATISVVRAPKGVTTIPEWIARDLAGSKLLGRREVSNLSHEPGACTQLIVAESDFEVGPGTYSHETSYYCHCAMTGRLYLVELQNWREDPNQKQFQATALRIALTLGSW